MKPVLKRDPWIDQQAEIVDRIVEDMKIVSGDIMGPSDATWQDVAGTLACNLEVLGAHIHKIRHGKHAVGHSSHLTMLIDQFREAIVGDEDEA